MKKGIVFGAFDLLHVGHIFMFSEAKQNCDWLIIALHIDPSMEKVEKHKPIESVFERQLKLNACKYVDQVILYEKEEDIALILKALKINIRFLGEDYSKVFSETPNPITAEDEVYIYFLHSLPIHSSDIRKRIIDDNN